MLPVPRASVRRLPDSARRRKPLRFHRASDTHHLSRLNSQLRECNVQYRRSNVGYQGLGVENLPCSSDFGARTYKSSIKLKCEQTRWRVLRLCMFFGNLKPAESEEQQSRLGRQFLENTRTQLWTSSIVTAAVSNV